MHKRPPGASWTWIPFNDLLFMGDIVVSIISLSVVSPVKLHLIPLVSMMGMNAIFSQLFSMYTTS